MIKYYGIDRKDEIKGASEFWQEGGLMEVSSNCNRFERRYDYDSFSMVDYQSCENCRHLGPDDSCLVHSNQYKHF